MQSAQDMIDLYIQAEKDLLEGKHTEINGRRYTAEDLDKLRAGRKEWEKRLLAEQNAAAGRNSSGPALAEFC